jgi:collagenase-like PrtC family protease
LTLCYFIRCLSAVLIVASLAEIREIKDAVSELELEVFVYGAA